MEIKQTPEQASTRRKVYVALAFIGAVLGSCPAGLVILFLGYFINPDGFLVELGLILASLAGAGYGIYLDAAPEVPASRKPFGLPIAAISGAVFFGAILEGLIVKSVSLFM